MFRRTVAVVKILGASLSCRQSVGGGGSIHACCVLPERFLPSSTLCTESILVLLRKEKSIVTSSTLYPYIVGARLRSEVRGNIQLGVWLNRAAERLASVAG